MANLGAFTFSAPNLGIISEELNGAPGSIIWAAIVYVLMQGIGSKPITYFTHQPFGAEFQLADTFIGRVTDIFGRRWIFVGTAFLGVTGDIICARAKNIPTIVVGYTFIGGGTCSPFHCKTTWPSLTEVDRSDCRAGFLCFRDC